MVPSRRHQRHLKVRTAHRWAGWRSLSIGLRFMSDSACRANNTFDLERRSITPGRRGRRTRRQRRMVWYRHGRRMGAVLLRFIPPPLRRRLPSGFRPATVPSPRLGSIPDRPPGSRLGVRRSERAGARPDPASAMASPAVCALRGTRASRTPIGAAFQRVPGAPAARVRSTRPDAPRGSSPVFLARVRAATRALPIVGASRARTHPDAISLARGSWRIGLGA